MEKFIEMEGIVMPLDRANVDTDAIIPKQFLKSIKRSGFGPNLFDEWRYLDHGEPGMDNASRPLNNAFVLNQERYQGAQILLARDNFGCGSSREHAPWALLDYGFRCIVAPSFADIFFNNCFKNGILPVVLNNKVIDDLFVRVENEPGFSMKLNLPDQKVVLPDGTVLDFEVDAFRKDAMLQGLDDIGMTMQKADKIRQFELDRSKAAPWVFQYEGM